MERLLGCIPASVQAATARAEGKKSDIEKVEQLAAPWDKSDQPSIIRWDKEWENHLKELADSYDALRDSGQLPPVWVMASLDGKDIEKLAGSIQRMNDCAAWATSRAALCTALFQEWLGAEIDIAKYNPNGIYAYSSGYTPRDWEWVPDNGRTIYAICETACMTGNFTDEMIGDYKAEARYTPLMLKTAGEAKENQLGFAYVGNRSAEELADIIILSLRACKPVVIGNSIALRDGTRKNSDGVYISDVGGGWGGGHATAACDIKKVGDKYYPFIYNSHGALYPAPDGRPPEGTYITRDGLIRYLSGSFADIMPCTYIERPRVEYYNLNIGGNING